MQQPIRKAVGRPRTPLEKLARLEDLTQFLKQNVHGALPRSEGDFSRFGNLLVALAKSQVDFAVVGGLAVIFNGYDRFTLDADMISGQDCAKFRCRAFRSIFFVSFRPHPA